jgi:signal recognition particle receptor subunit beta
MAYDGFNPDGDPVAPLAVKLLIAGGFGVGKTTFVRAVTEIKSLHTEEYISQRGAQTDRLADVPDKQTTTVALDFGRITIDDEIVLYLFGMPGQERFWFMWNELGYGATGVVILADTRRLADCFTAVDYFELRQIPFIVAVNAFDGAPRFHPESVRAALDLDPHVPLVICDARDRTSCRDVLLALIAHLRRLQEGAYNEHAMG